MSQYSRRYLVTRAIVRSVFWLGVFLGVLYLADLISPYL